jgi:flagellar hook assembly protein FlgD
VELAVGDLLQLGAVNQEAWAGPAGDSWATTDTASASLDLMALLGPNPALSEATLDFGAVGTYAEIDGETGQLTRTTTIADLALTLQSPLVADLTGDVNTVVSGLTTDINALEPVLTDTINQTIGDVMQLIGVTGTVDSTTTVDIDTSRLDQAIAGVLNQTVCTDLVCIDLTTGAITADLAGGVDLNNLAPNTKLTGVLTQVSDDVATLLAQVQAELNQILTNALDYVDITINSDTTVTDPLLGTNLGGLTIDYTGTLQDLMDGTSPLVVDGTGVVGTALDPLLGEATTLLQDAIVGTVNTTLGTAVADAGAAVDALVTDLAAALDPVLDSLAGVADITLNEQNESDGMTSEAWVTAIDVDVLTGPLAGVTLDLATSSVGPNTYAPLSPTIDATDDPVSGGTDAPVDGAGWHPNSEVTLELLNPDGSPVLDAAGNPVTVTVTTDETGAFTTTIPLPDGLAAGDYTVQASDATGNTATDTITVIAPTLDATDQPVAPGDDAPVTSGGWTPNTEITVQLTDADGNPVGDPITVTTDADGSFPAGTTFPVPEGIADGEYTLVGTDPFGNTASDTLVVDATAPAVQITSPTPGEVTNDPTPTIEGTVDDPNATVDVVITDPTTGAVVWEGPATVNPDGTWTATPDVPLPDGDYTVTATATDEAGNTSTDGPVGFTVDTTAPAVDITSPTEGEVTNDATPTIEGTVEDPDSTVVVTITDPATGEVVFEGPATVNPDGTWTVDAPTLADGDYEVTATATDPAGNEATDGPVAFTVDTTAPVVDITSPADGSTTTDTTPTIEGTVDDPNATVDVVITDDAGNVVWEGPATVNPDGTWTATPDVPLPDGDYTITATATDEAGNTSTDQVGFTVDATAPAVDITSPTEGEVTNDATPTIEGTVDDPNATVDVVITDDAGNVVFEGPATVNPDGTWTVDAPTLADGDYTVEVTATDPAGNTSTDGPVGFTVDTVAPAVDITSPTEGEVTNDATPTVEGTVDDPNATVDVVITDDAGNVVWEGPATVNPDGTWTATPDVPLPDGDYTVTATATDEAGNTSTDGPVGFTVDATAPAVAITSPADGSTTTDTTPTITGTVDDTAESVTVTIRDADGNVVFEGEATINPDGTWTIDAPELPDGDYTVTATATDANGNEATAGPVAFAIDTGAPDAPVITSPTEGEVTDDATPPITGTGEPGATVEVVITDADGNETTYETVVEEDGTWTVVPTIPLPDGETTVVATQTDEAGNTSPASEPVTFVVDTTAPEAPVITSPAEGSTTTDTTPLVTGTGEPGATVEVKIDGVVVGTTTVKPDGTWELQVTEPLSGGEHTVSATQTDEAGNTSPAASNTFTVDAGVAPPVITSPQTGDEVSQTPTVTGTGQPGATVTVYVDGNPVGTATVGADGEWSLALPELACGTHTITATQTVDGTASRKAHAKAAMRVTSAHSEAVTVTVVCPTGGVDGGGDAGDDGVGAVLPDTGSPFGIAALVLLALLGMGMVAGGTALVRRHRG